MVDKAKAPAEVLADQGRGETETIRISTDEFSERRTKRKTGNVWREGRYFNGSTIFDVWKWTGEPLQWKRA